MGGLGGLETKPNYDVSTYDVKRIGFAVCNAPVKHILSDDKMILYSCKHNNNK